MSKSCEGCGCDPCPGAGGECPGKMRAPVRSEPVDTQRLIRSMHLCELAATSHGLIGMAAALGDNAAMIERLLQEHAAESGRLKRELAAEQQEAREVRSQLYRTIDRLTAACVQVATLRRQQQLGAPPAPEFPHWDAEIVRHQIRDALATEMPRRWANIAVGLPESAGPTPPIGFTIEETIALRERARAAGGRLVLIINGEQVGELVLEEAHSAPCGHAGCHSTLCEREGAGG